MNDLKYSLGPLQHGTAVELAYRLRQPIFRAPQSCVLLLHGVGGKETDLADLAFGLDPDAAVVLPRGRLRFAPGQYGWFHVKFSANGPNINADEAEDSRLVLIGFVKELQAAYGIDGCHTVIAGFSQGGIMSASVGLSTPDLIAGFGVLSGRILPELKPHLAARDRLATLRAFIGHGQFDEVLPVWWAQQSDELLSNLGVPHVTRLYPVGHSPSASMRADFLAWACGLTATR